MQAPPPSQDPASLVNLNPIVLPEPVPPWPPAPGWYVLLALAAGLALWAGVRWWRRRRAEQYRRQALAEMDALNDARAIPDLLKRAALSAFPRGEVAGLTGTAWHRFLDATAGQCLFTGEVGRLLDRAGYGDGVLETDELTRLHAAARDWLKTHRREQAP